MDGIMKRVRNITLFLVLLSALGYICIALLSVYIIIVPHKSNKVSYTGQKVCITSFDGKQLAAYKKTPPNCGHKWVLLVHSYRSDHTFMNPYAEEYLNNNYIVLQPDNRAHGDSQGDFIGMGYLDQYDLLQWIQYIIMQDPEAEIVLHGVSMGASALMMLSSQDNIPDNIIAIIEDSGYKSADDYLAWKLKKKAHLPAFPAIPIANTAIKLIAGYSLYDASAIEGVKHSKVPILFIHGTNDQTVPVEDAYDLYNAASCRKDLLIINNAGHGEAVVIDEQLYWGSVYQFINKN